MKLKNLAFFLLIFVTNKPNPDELTTNNFSDIAKEGYAQYQDIIIDNIVVKKATDNHNHCDTRYQIIKQILNQYKRPFALLDIGAAQGYYSFRAAYDFQDAVCMMIEANNKFSPKIGDQLFDLCKANKNLNNIIYLNKLFTSNDLQHLSECEHFDVVLAMNIIHLIDDWQIFAESILNMANNIIIETPPQESIVNEDQNNIRKSIEEYIIKKGGTKLATVPRHTSNTTANIYLIQSKKKYLQRKTWLLPRRNKNDYVIESSFSDKKLTKPVYWPTNKLQTNSWIPGINLLTFKMCNGIYPTKEMIKRSLNQIKREAQSDWMINNMILQGNKMTWIDTQDFAREYGATLKQTNFSEGHLQRHYTLIDLDEPSKIENYFWNTLIRLPVEKQHKINLFGKFLIPKALIFDIQSEDMELLNIYLGYGAKVLSFNLLDKSIDKLIKKYKNIFFIDNKIIKANIGPITLDNIIALYGQPRLCNIHLKAESVLELLKGLTKPIQYLIFKFDIKSLSHLKESLNLLDKLEYKSYNFSVRDIPLLRLDFNIHTNIKKEWSVSGESLLNEIQQASLLDHNPERFWGYIYATTDLLNS